MKDLIEQEKLQLEAIKKQKAEGEIFCYHGDQSTEELKALEERLKQDEERKKAEWERLKKLEEEKHKRELEALKKSQEDEKLT